jgi:hypothetical protein
MKKGIVLLVMMCALGLKGQAQIYAYDQAIELPKADLYDMDMVNAYANALRETAPRRQQLFRFYSDKAVEAGMEKEWELCIYYVDKALDTGCYNGDIYVVRGLANEQLGRLKDAKKDYKTGKKMGSEYAANALEQLKEKMKRR